jgi:hypothetical protein
VAKKAAPQEHWKREPEEHDFPAAAAYLSLLFAAKAVDSTLKSLRGSDPTERKAKDLLRASRLPLLPPDDPHVAIDLKKVERGRRLSPVLLVRGRGSDSIPLIVADGYHRICASYHLDEDADIPCLIAELP